MVNVTASCFGGLGLDGFSGRSQRHNTNSRIKSPLVAVI
jgi:hypothetical protein